MTINTFWRILIKILGLLLILGALTVIPQWFSSMYSAYQIGDFESLTILAIIFLAILFIYYFVFRLCVYKTSWIIEKLKLDRDFETQNIELNSKSFTIISIATIVIGGLIFVENIPLLLREIFIFFQQESLFKDYPKTGWILFDFFKVILGYLLITNSSRIAKFIDNQKKNA
ncbi:hypothetical protein DMB65_17025 [Flavobacterium cheongpyeongense]|uniref:Uncharacterized protein n=1 Tax=Flavobacterium cheongpyeongense TaxID=2212651 RepID=A0A2V4BZT8_9FLAO|nr:hypothetical protein [Flavobacterium cheongpyeongense]PXY39524.1 hypothetical protein DMB65_17025 [Flavobacterium cheongpyeongense]